jgi:hypothetical protein
MQEKGERRMRYNQELYRLYWSPDIIRKIKVAWFPWAGHLQRMDSAQENRVFQTRRKRESREDLNFGGYWEGKKIWGI